MIHHDTQLNMIIGNPLTHTQSPLLHNTVYRLLNCNAIMLPHTSHDLFSSIAALKTLSVGLIAITMPFKKTILDYIDISSVEVNTLKAANTVINREGKLYGFNTDIAGIAYALRHINLANKNILIVGAGGAAHAAAYYLAENNANLFWLNRSPERAITAIQLFGGSIVHVNQLNALAIDIIINTTPVGMFPDIAHSPLPVYQFNSQQIIFDMVYNPVDTLLIKTARKQGAHCINGLEMFIGQGLKQIELWLAKPIAQEHIIHLIKTQLTQSQAITRGAA